MTPISAGESVRAAAFDLAPEPALVVGVDGRVQAANEAAERLFGQSLGVMTRNGLSAAVSPDSSLLSLVDRARSEGGPVRERAFEVSLFGQAMFRADGSAAPLDEGAVLLTLTVRSGALSGERGGVESAGLRTIVGLGQMLAHEIKNPLSGIRGAAQLLESSVPDEDRVLTRLICDETDRIVKLVERVEMFGDDRPGERSPVNIHDVLDHVRRLAVSGFARGLRFVEEYDPSLPPVDAVRDQLVQVFLNLLKNAAEAMDPSAQDGEIVISTAFRPGIRMQRSGHSERVALPLEICIRDNGAGVPPDLLPHLFDPFVTTKAQGSGLGLALVAKIIGNHGGIIECKSVPKRTTFRILLPIHRFIDGRRMMSAGA